jgi:hypothetical protein
MPEYLDLPSFTGGVNRILDPRQIPDNQVLKAQNLVPYARGVLEKRKGGGVWKVCLPAAAEGQEPDEQVENGGFADIGAKVYEGTFNTEYKGTEEGNWVYVRYVAAADLPEVNAPGYYLKVTSGEFADRVYPVIRATGGKVVFRNADLRLLWWIPEEDPMSGHDLFDGVTFEIWAVFDEWEGSPDNAPVLVEDKGTHELWKFSYFQQADGPDAGKAARFRRSYVYGHSDLMRYGVVQKTWWTPTVSGDHRLVFKVKYSKAVASEVARVRLYGRDLDEENPATETFVFSLPEPEDGWAEREITLPALSDEREYMLHFSIENVPLPPEGITTLTDISVKQVDFEPESTVPARINAIRSLNIGDNHYMIAAVNGLAGTGATDSIYYSKNRGEAKIVVPATSTDALTLDSDYSITVDHLSRVYISNGVNAIQVSADGENRVNLVIDDSTGYLPDVKGKYILWWKDRLFVANVTLGENKFPHAVHWSGNLEPGKFAADAAIFAGEKDANDPITGIVPLTMTSADKGLTTYLCIFRKNSIWKLEFGEDGPVALDQISGVTGCWDPKSIVSTPIGVMFCGWDNVYLLPWQGEPQPIGNAIKPVWDGSDPELGRNRGVRTAAAHYFGGFVRFAYPSRESEYNDREFWFDTREVSDVGWFGPMVGLDVACYYVEGNRIYAGGANSGEIYELELPAYQDNGQPIAVDLRTKIFAPQTEFTTKIYKRWGFNVQVAQEPGASDTTRSVTAAWEIDDGMISGEKTRALAIPATPVFSELKGLFGPADRGRAVQMVVQETSGARFRIRNGVLSYEQTGRVL